MGYMPFLAKHVRPTTATSHLLLHGKKTEESLNHCYCFSFGERKARTMEQGDQKSSHTNHQFHLLANEPPKRLKTQWWCDQITSNYFHIWSRGGWDLRQGCELSLLSEAGLPFPG